MIERAAKKIANFICANIGSSPDMYDVYKYGTEITLSSILNALWIILASVILSDIWSGLIFLVIFMLLRPFTGGYHAKSYFACNAVFLLTYLLVFLINDILTSALDAEFTGKILESLIIIGIIPIIAFAPISNLNKPLNAKQIKRCRVIGISVYIVTASAALILNFFGIRFGSLMIATLSAVSLMMVIEKIKRRRCK